MSSKIPSLNIDKPRDLNRGVCSFKIGYNQFWLQSAFGYNQFLQSLKPNDMTSTLWQLQNVDCFTLKCFVLCDKYAPVLLNLIIRCEKRDTMRQSEPRILFLF